MFRVYSFLFIFCAGLILAFYAQKYTHAQSIEEAVAIPAPEPVEVVVTSAGPLNCYKIKEGFWRGKWVTEHRVCQYQNDKRMAWVEEHWTCYLYDKDNGCMTWIKWSSGWDKTIYIVKSYIVKSHTRRSLYSSCYEPDFPLDPCCGYSCCRY